MDFLRHLERFVPSRGGTEAQDRASARRSTHPHSGAADSSQPGTEAFFLRFSKIATVFWACALVLVAYLSRRVEFVLNAAFSLRGLTSGALLGGLALAVFWKKGRGAPVITGMFVSLAVMTAIELLPKLDHTKTLWMHTIGTEIFWPWYTLIGLVLTVAAAWLTQGLFPPKSAAADGKS